MTPPNRYWSQTVCGLHPYVPGEQPAIADLVKLNTNESPWGPSPRALAAMRAAASDDLRRYPDPESTRLRAAIAQTYGVAPEQVFVGNGSDEVLAHAFAALLKHPEPLWLPEIGYSFYPTYCRLYGVEYATVPLAADFRIRPADYAPQDGHRAGAIILANPNAPTGIALSVAEIEEIVAANSHAPVVIDEAYIDFADSDFAEPLGTQSAVPLTRRYDNLLVVQTLSKSRALAGLRVGFAIGHVGLIEALNRVKNSFNSYPLSRVAQAGAEAAVRDTEHLRQTCQSIVASRGWLTEELTQLGFQVLPSATNFVFARHPDHAGSTLAAALRARGILVRHFAQPRIDNFLRITVGSDAQCQRLCEVLAEVL